MEYDGAFSLVLKDAANRTAADLRRLRPPCLGNGRVVFTPGWDAERGIDLVRDSAATHAVHPSDVPRLTGIFGAGLFRIKRFDPRHAMYDLREAGVDMSTNTATQSWAALDLQTGRTAALAYTSAYALRHVPPCTMQTLELRFAPRHALRGIEDRQGFDVFHGAVPPPGVPPATLRYRSTIRTFEYRFSRRTRSVHVFAGDGVRADTGEAVAFASAYLWDDEGRTSASGADAFVPQGVSADGWNHIFVRVPPRGVLGGAAADADGLETRRIAVLTCHLHGATSTDCEAVLLAQLARYGGDLSEAERGMRRAHVAGWMDLWSSDVALTAAPAAAPDETARVRQLALTSREALHAVYSRVRENADTVVDGDFTGAVTRAAWLLPLLSFLHPRIAGGMLERMFAPIARAMQDAARTGVTAVPLHNSVRSALAAPLDLLAAHVCREAWNHFRTTHEDQWLATRGFAIIAALADFLAARLGAGGRAAAYYIDRGGYDADDDDGSILAGAEDAPPIMAEAFARLFAAEHGGAEPRLVIPLDPAEENANGDDDAHVRDHLYTSTVTLAALDAAIEAARVLRLFPRTERWELARDALGHKFRVAVGYYHGWPEQRIIPVLPAYAGFFERSLSDGLRVTDALAAFAGDWASVWTRVVGLTHEQLDALALVNNDYYRPLARMLPDGREHPLNLAWSALATARLAQHRPGFVHDAWNELVQLAGALRDEGAADVAAGNERIVLRLPRNNEAGAHSSECSESLGAAVFLETLLSGLCAKQPAGAVSAAGYAYRAFFHDLHLSGRRVLPCALGAITIRLYMGPRQTARATDNEASSTRVLTRVVLNNFIACPYSAPYEGDDKLVIPSEDTVTVVNGSF